MVEKWGRRLMSFVVFAIIARLVTPEAFGTVALAMVYITFVELFSRQGIGMAIVQAKDPDKTYIDTAFTINVISGLAVALLSVIFSHQIAQLLGDEKLANVVSALSLAVIINSACVVPIALQTKEFRFKDIAFQSLLGTCAGGIVGIVLALLGFEVWALVLQTLIFALTNAVTVWIATKWKPHLGFSKQHAGQITRFSFKVLAINLMSFLRLRSDQVVVGLLTGPLGLGLYSLGQRLVKTVEAFVSTPAESVAMPSFSKIQGEPERLRNAVGRAVEINALLTMPAFAGTALMAPEIIYVLFGEKWMPAAPACSVIAVTAMINAIFFVIYPALMGQGHPGKVFTFQAFQGVLAMGFAWLGGKWGILGVSYGILASTTIVSIGSFIWIEGILNFRLTDLLKKIAATVASVLLMAAALLALRYGGVFQQTGAFIGLPLGVLAGGLSFMTGIYLLNRELLLKVSSMVLPARWREKTDHFLQKKKA